MRSSGDLAGLVLGIDRCLGTGRGQATLEVGFTDGLLPDVVAAHRVHDEEDEQGDDVCPDCEKLKTKGGEMVSSGT